MSWLPCRSVIVLLIWPKLSSDWSMARRMRTNESSDLICQPTSSNWHWGQYWDFGTHIFYKNNHWGCLMGGAQNRKRVEKTRIWHHTFCRPPPSIVANKPKIPAESIHITFAYGPDHCSKTDLAGIQDVFLLLAIDMSFHAIDVFLHAIHWIAGWPT